MGYLSILSDRRRERLYKDYDDDGRRRAGVNWSAYWANKFNLVLEGHSFASTGVMGSELIRTIYPEYYHNFAAGASHVTDIEARSAMVDAEYITNCTKNILVIWIGVNDVDNIEGTGASTYADLKSYIKDRIAVGWKPYVYTMTPTNSEGRNEAFETERSVFNNLLKTDLVLLDGVQIMDTDTVTQLSDYTDTDYYLDGIHPSASGHFYAAQLFTNKMLDLYPSMRTTSIGDTPEIAFTLTATGTGDGIATLKLRASEVVVLSVDENAKIYTNATATIGEDNTIAIVPGYDAIIYIKCTSGISNLRIDKNKITKIVDWVSSTNAPSLGGSITTLISLTYLRLVGNNTISGSIEGMTSLAYLVVSGSNTISGDITYLLDLTYINIEGSNTLSGSITGKELTTLVCTGSNTISGELTLMTGLTYLKVQGSNTLSGDITALIGLTYCVIAGANTVTGSIDALVKLTFLQILGSNTVSGDVKNISDGLERCWINPGRMDSYTTGGNWGSIVASGWIYLTPSTGYGLSISELTLLISDVSSTKVVGRAISIILTGSNALMADTTQGGIWGDFDGETSPSDLAIAYKNLVKTDLCTVALKGIAAPGVSGDGTGFPAGFGDWYRS